MGGHRPRHRCPGKWVIAVVDARQPGWVSTLRRAHGSPSSRARTLAQALTPHVRGRDPIYKQSCHIDSVRERVQPQDRRRHRSKRVDLCLLDVTHWSGPESFGRTVVVNDRVTRTTCLRHKTNHAADSRR